MVPEVKCKDKLNTRYDYYFVLLSKYKICTVHAKFYYFVNASDISCPAMKCCSFCNENSISREKNYSVQEEWLIYYWLWRKTSRVLNHFWQGRNCEDCLQVCVWVGCGCWHPIIKINDCKKGFDNLGNGLYSNDIWLGNHFKPNYVTMTNCNHVYL